MTGAFEEVFNPAQAAARRELQRQRDLGARLPAATDPPAGDEEEPEENRVAAPGRRGTPFSGIVVLRRPSPGADRRPAPPAAGD